MDFILRSTILSGLILFLLINGFCVAQEAEIQAPEHQSKFYYQMGESVYFPDTPPAEKKEVKIFPITPYQFCLRVGGGYALPLLSVDFGSTGTVNGTPNSDIDGDDVEINYFPAFAGNLEIKFAFPDPFDKLSVGISANYNILSLDNIKVKTDDGTTFKSDDMNVHVASFFAFLEYRVPIQAGDSWVVPYGRFGVGININLRDNRDDFRIDEPTLGIFAALGVEYYLGEKVSLFFEPRWNYNTTNIQYRPNDTTKFDGKLDLSNLTVLVGLNFYFGTGKSL